MNKNNEYASEEKIKQLKLCFPHENLEILKSALLIKKGDVEAASNDILDFWQKNVIREVNRIEIN